MIDAKATERKLLADRLKEARKLAGISQGNVARIIGLHRPTISEIEAGNRRVSASELARLAQVYDVSVSWLLGQPPESIDPQDPRLELAARELTKLKPDDLDRLLKLLAAIRNDSMPKVEEKTGDQPESRQFSSPPTGHHSDTARFSNRNRGMLS